MNPLSFSALRLFLSVTVLICASFALAGCSRGVVRETAAETRIEKPKPPGSPMWLGNPERNFYGTGPLKNGALRIVWEAETDFIKGRLHKDPWGGSSWPGQPSINGDRVYFPSADGYVYCLNAGDGSVIWDYETGFEVDGSTIVVGDRVYFGGEDHYFYCLNLADGALVYKVLVGSVEGSITIKNGRVYLGTEEGDLYCINPADGKFIWKARIGADSDSTPAVANGFVYTAAEDGVVRCYKQDTGELVWNFVIDGGHLGNANEHI